MQLVAGGYVAVASKMVLAVTGWSSLRLFGADVLCLFSAKAAAQYKCEAAGVAFATRFEAHIVV